MTTSKGVQFEVDDDCLDLIEMRGWTLHASGYICREIYVLVDNPAPGRRTRRHRIWLHHEVLGTQPDPARRIRIDHIDTNRLNNRRSNLRAVTHAQNLQNRPAVNRRGGHRGVGRRVNKSGTVRWVARAMIDYRVYNIGSFKTEDAAIEAAAEWRRINMTHSSQDEIDQ